MDNHLRILEGTLARAPLPTDVERRFLSEPRFNEAFTRNPYLMAESWTALHRRKPPARDARYLYARPLEAEQQQMVVDAGEVRLSVLRGWLSSNELSVEEIDRLASRRMPVGSAMLLGIQPNTSNEALRQLVSRLPARHGMRFAAFISTAARLDDTTVSHVLDEWGTPVQVPEAKRPLVDFDQMAPAWRSLPGFRAAARILWQRPILRLHALRSGSIAQIAAAASFDVDYSVLTDAVRETLRGINAGTTHPGIRPADLLRPLEMLCAAEAAWERPGIVANLAGQCAEQFGLAGALRARLAQYRIGLDVSLFGTYTLEPPVRGKQPPDRIAQAARNINSALYGSFTPEDADRLAADIALKGVVEMYGEATVRRCLTRLESFGADHRDVPTLPKRAWRMNVEQQLDDIETLELDKLIRHLDRWPYGSVAEQVADITATALGNDVARWETLAGLGDGLVGDTLSELLELVDLLA